MKLVPLRASAFCSAASPRAWWALRLNSEEVAICMARSVAADAVGAKGDARGRQSIAACTGSPGLACGRRTNGSSSRIGSAISPISQ